MTKKKRSKPSKPPSARPARRLSDSPLFPWLVALFYAVLLLVLFWPFITSDGWLFGSDAASANLYMKTFYTEALKQGSFPQWAPALFGGMPFVDAFHSDIFYPLSLPFYLLLPIERALGWVVIWHLLLAGLGMYAAARQWHISRWGSSLAGLNYMLAPFLVSMVLPGHTGRIFVVALFPLGFLLLKRIWDDGRIRDMGLFALLEGLVILTPHVQMTYYTFWAFGAYSIYRLIGHLRASRRIPWIPVAGSAGAIVLALGVGAVQFLPSYHYVQTVSPRSGEGLTYDVAASWSLHPEDLVNLFVSDFSGTAVPGDWTYWGHNKFKDRLEHCGLIATLLAFWAGLFSRWRDRWFFVGLGLFGLIYGLGAYTPVHKLFYYVMPLVKSTRAPAMIYVFVLFSVSLLAGAAVDGLRSRGKGRADSPRGLWFFWLAAISLFVAAVLMSIDSAAMLQVYTGLFYSDIPANHAYYLENHRAAITGAVWLACALAVALAIWVQAWRRRRWIWTIPILLLVVGLDHMHTDRRFLVVYDLDEILPDDRVVDFLHAQPGPFRMYSGSDYIPEDRLPAWATRPAFHINYFALHGLAEFTGYHGNQLWAYSRLLGGGSHIRAKDEHLPRAMDLCGVRYLLYLRRANQDGEPGDTTLALIHHDRGIKVYENTAVPDHVRLVSCWELADAADSLFERLYEPDFDPRRCVLVDEPPSFASTNDALTAGTAQVMTYEREHVVVNVQAHRPALLVIADCNYESWFATIDGEPAPVLTANGTFRAVELPAGEHVVVFEYRSWRLKLGAWLSIVSVLLAGAVAVYGWRRRR